MEKIDQAESEQLDDRRAALAEIKRIHRLTRPGRGRPATKLADPEDRSAEQRIKILLPRLGDILRGALSNLEPDTAIDRDGVCARVADELGVAVGRWVLVDGQPGVSVALSAATMQRLVNALGGAIDWHNAKARSRQPGKRRTSTMIANDLTHVVAVTLGWVNDAKTTRDHVVKASHKSRKSRPA